MVYLALMENVQTVYSWKNVRTMVWDFTCSDIIAPNHIQISSAFPRKVAKSAETAKLKKYCNLLADYEVIPIGVETWLLGSKRTEIDERSGKNSSRNRRTAVNLLPTSSYKYGHSERECL